MVETCAPLMEKRTENAFTQTGFDNWKKVGEKCVAHSRSQLHSEAVMKWKLGQQPGIDAVMDQSCKAEQICCRKMLIKQLESLRYLLKQGLAVRDHEEADGNLYQLLLLRSNDCLQLKALFPMKLPMLATRSSSVMCIWWVGDDFSVNEDFLELIQLPKTELHLLSGTALCETV